MEFVNKIKKQIGKLIRDARTEKNWTQNDLAQKMGVTQPFISKLEKGESMPESKTRKKLIKILGEDFKQKLEKILQGKFDSLVVESEKIKGNLMFPHGNIEVIIIMPGTIRFFPDRQSFEKYITLLKTTEKGKQSFSEIQIFLKTQ